MHVVLAIFLFVKSTNLDLLQVDVLIMLRDVIIMGTKCSVLTFLVSTLIEPFAKLTDSLKYIN